MEAVIILRVNLPNNPTLKIDLNWIPIKEAIFALFISQTGTNVGHLYGREFLLYRVFMKRNNKV